MQVYRMLGVVIVLMCISCVSTRRTEPQTMGGDGPRGETVLVGIIESAEETDDDGLDITMRVTAILSGGDGRVKRDERVKLLVPWDHLFASFGPLDISVVLRSRPEDEYTLGLIKDHYRDELKRKRKKLIGRTYRVVYHGEFSVEYAGRFSAWEGSASAPPDSPLEIVGVVRQIVPPAPGEVENRHQISVAVSRVLADHKNVLEGIDTVGFYSSDFAGLSGAYYRWLPGRHEGKKFKIAFLGPFKQPYRGRVQASEW